MIEIKDETGKVKGWYFIDEFTFGQEGKVRKITRMLDEEGKVGEAVSELIPWRDLPAEYLEQRNKPSRMDRLEARVSALENERGREKTGKGAE